MKVLFVCLGNICRSPMAEAIFNHKVKEMGLSDTITSDSCGTANYHVGDLPDRRTIRVVEKNGIQINHRGRQLCKDDFEQFDYVLAMDRSNHEDILYLADSKKVKGKISLMRAFDHVDGDEVPDPYYGDDSDFQFVFEMLDRNLDAFLKTIVREHLKA